METPQITELSGDGRQNRYTDFYNNASILPKHRYFVGLYGENVNQSLKKMADSVVGNTLQKKLQKSALDRFIKNHAFYTQGGKYDGNAEVQLKWTVKNVSVPSVQTEIENNFTIDAVKTINYPLIKGQKSNGILKLDIVENRDMTMYHFFNALMNSFFNAQVLKAKSSFHKLGMYVCILNGVEAPNNLNPESKEITDIYPLQIFEFNSIVPLGIGELNPSTSLQGEKLEYSVTFQAPNLFQSSFQTISDFNGLRDNSSDKTLGAMANGDYKIDVVSETEPIYAFEVDRSTFKNS